MLEHHYIADYNKTETLTGLFQNVQEPVACPRRAQKRQSPVTRAGDKVQVMRAVGAMQAAGMNISWYRQKSQGRGTLKSKLS